MGHGADGGSGGPGTPADRWRPNDLGVQRPRLEEINKPACNPRSLKEEFNLFFYPKDG